MTFWALTVSFTVYYGVFSALAFHLYPLLLERGLTAAGVVSVIAVVGPAQVAGRVAMWTLARRGSARVLGSCIVAVFPPAIGWLLAAPAGFWSMAAFAAVYGAANGIMTIVRGVAVPEMLTRQAYGEINGAMATPIMVTKAAGPLLGAWLWSLTQSYTSLVAAALAGSLISALAYWIAAAGTPHHRPSRHTEDPLNDTARAPERG